jgi:short-subunit dehydrogenase
MKNGKTILITGATKGIGRHAALYLARKGHRVIATGRDEAALATLRDEAQGTTLETLRLDVTDAASIAAAKAEVDRRTDGRGLDALVNNAGYGIAVPLEMIDDADLRAQFDTNVFGLVAVTRAFLPQMRERGEGRVVNVSSVGGRITLPFFGAYNATKYAVESMSDALRLEMAPFGVHVVLIEPGVIESEFSKTSFDLLGKYRASASPYSFVLERAERIKQQSDATAVGPECVARAMERAITARRPAARYVAPARTRALLAMKALLPTRWMDAMMGAIVGLTRRRRLAHAAATSGARGRAALQSA